MRPGRRGARAASAPSLRGVTALGALWTALFAGWGCPWFENMADQPSVRPLEQKPFPAPAGTVPIGYAVPPAITYEAANGLANPQPPDPASLARGKALYETYCQVCHGPAGAGDGPVIAKFVRPPNLKGASRGFTDGYIFALITNGRGNMPSYASVSPEERWDVINYLRSLQATP